MTHDRIRALQQAYGELYGQNETHDSPERSRPALLRSMTQWLLTNANPHPVILNLGAGPQMLERQWQSVAKNRGQEALRKRMTATTLVTLDIASIARKRLAARDVPHVRADSGALPFADESVDLIVSNHSIDMLRADQPHFDKALKEAQRVLCVGGVVLLNYHPPVLHERLSQLFATRRELRRNLPHQAQFYDGVANPYYEDDGAIAGDLRSAGLEPTRIDYAALDGQWWEVEAHKPLSGTD
jgi:hypothetical protein